MQLFYALTTLFYAFKKVLFYLNYHAKSNKNVIVEILRFIKLQWI